MSSKPHPHACTARKAPFPLSGGDYVSTGKTLKPAVSSTKPAAEPKPAAARGTKHEEKPHG